MFGLTTKFNKMQKDSSIKPQNPALCKTAFISRFFFNERMYVKLGRDKADPEKTVFPTLLFINTNHEAFTDLRHRGFMLCVGWWDFSIKVGLFF
jgi:hypothetical protein